MEPSPGTPAYLMDSRGARIKDCSNCLFPHKPENYEAVLQCLQQQEEMIAVRLDEIYSLLLEQVEQMAHWRHMLSETQEWQRETALEIYQNSFRKKKITFLLQPFDASCVKRSSFRFGEQEVFCQVLERIPEEEIVQGYLYTFHAPAAEEGASLLEQFYGECWQIACMDAGRIWLQQYLTRKHSIRSEHFVTEAFGPGFYGMPMDAVRQLHSVIRGERVGVTLGADGTLQPLKSSIGLYLVMKKALPFSMKDCMGCIGNWKGCSLCGNSYCSQKGAE